ncbi:MAG: hypothetical protein AAB152_15865 [Candidatus Coatesbacteria bacterium]
MERRTWTRGAVAALAMATVLVFGISRPSLAGGPGAAGVEKLLKNCGLKYNWDDENKIGTVGFSDFDYTCSKKVLVYANNDAEGYYVILNLCLVDKGAGYGFSAEFLKKCMEINNSLAVLRLGLNSKQGRIYATFGVDMSDLPAAILKDYIMLIAKRGDEVAKDLNAALSGGSSEGSSGSSSGSSSGGGNEWNK